MANPSVDDQEDLPPPGEPVETLSLLRRPLTAIEEELARMALHLNDCPLDSFKCEMCSAIDLRLQDGLQHFRNDPGERFKELDHGLQGLAKHLERIYLRLEGGPVPKGILRALHEAAEVTEAMRGAMRLPLTASPLPSLTPIQAPPRFRRPITWTRALEMLAALG